MRLLVDIGAVAIGLIVGAAVGYWIGLRWESRRRTLWTIAGAAFAIAWIVDLAGYAVGHPEVSIGSVGLMAGIVTGVKYGGFSPLRALDQPAGTDVPAPDESEAATPAPRGDASTPQRDDAPAP